MSPLFEDLWIFTRNGEPIIEVLNDSVMDSALLGPFLSALGSFSQELSGKALRGFSFGNEKFFIIPSLKDEVFLVGKCHNSVKEKKVKKSFNVIREFFENMYTSEDIINWNRDTSMFDKFKDKLDLYFKMLEL